MLPQEWEAEVPPSGMGPRKCSPLRRMGSRDSTLRIGASENMLPQEWGAEVSPPGMGPESVLPKNGKQGFYPRNGAPENPRMGGRNYTFKDEPQKLCAPRMGSKNHVPPGTWSKN